jgi:uncharacterized protein (TIGR02145 family)
MKKLLLALTLISVSVACKKETSTTNSNTNGITNDTTKTTNQPTSGFGPNIKDIESNTYKTVYIGTQQWMAENLKVSKYNDGTQLPNVTDSEQWSNLTSGAWTFYNNNATNNVKYGKLYNWYTVNKSTNGNKNICPSGWHVPSYDEWSQLINYLGGMNVAGGKMKEMGTSSWKNPNNEASNISLFNGLPGGLRTEGGSYDDISDNGIWWSSTQDPEFNQPILVELSYINSKTNLGSSSKNCGFSVRCLKD